jgi:DNA-directed RNA polymerase subunit RPC12/RpoP
VMLRAIPHWREVGTEKWVEDEEARYHCPSCGHKLFRGAKRCNRCKAEVDLDG